MRQREPDVMSHAREIVAEAVEGMAFEAATPENRAEIRRRITEAWKKTEELHPPPEPEVTITTTLEGQVTRVWACIPIPFYVEVPLVGREAPDE